MGTKKKTDQVEAIERIRCRTCKQVTKHVVVYEHRTELFDEEACVHYGERSAILECRGCGTIAYRTVYWNSDDVDHNGVPDKRVEIFPDSNSTQRTAMFLPDASKEVALVYNESVRAFNAGALLLTAVGLRATVEAICRHHGCAGENLPKMIASLVTKGAIARAQADFLDVQRWLGNDAIHNGLVPAKNELEMALEIIETVLKNLYVLPEWAADIKASVGRRRAKANAARTGAASGAKPAR